jgi:hypothetical protein
MHADNDLETAVKTLRRSIPKRLIKLRDAFVEAYIDASFVQSEAGTSDQDRLLRRYQEAEHAFLAELTAQLHRSK